MSLSTALFIAFFVGMMLMHLRGHGHGGMGCGGHNHGNHDKRAHGNGAGEPPSGHHHG